MTIYRGPGGTGEARTDSDITEVRIIADEAEGYKDQAATSASAAASSASAAATAETNAETAEANAETAEANAEAAQAAAEAAQAAAEAAQTAAEAAQAAAETAEANAETAEANAETAEANAETAQAAAEAALASAQAVYDDFDDRYLGAKSSNPSVDNDGGALTAGALYFNTTVPEMRVYTGSAWTDFSAGAAVSSFNTRTGPVTLLDTDVNTALGYTAANSSTVALKANNLSDLASASAARTNLGLGTAATTASTDYATAAQGVKADTALQSYTETDPVYLASSWYGTTNNSSNWNTAYGWGNHASAGYATYPSQTGNSGKYLTTNGSTTSWATVSGGVTSVSGTSPVVSSGGTTPAISLASGYGDTQNPYASKTANYVLASPNGSAGVPSFRALVAADIPTLNQNTTGTAASLSTASGSAPSYSARAWVNFNGTGTVAIRASGNVSSITDNGTGAYTVNFATALPDADFSAAFSCAFAVDGNDYATGGSNKSTTICDVFIVNSGNGNRYDSNNVTAVIFR
jgi:hypothetical protein